MNDNEIVKALEEWRKELIADYQRLQLLGAPMDCFEESHADTITKLSNTLDLINRLQAENERLKNSLAISQKETKRFQDSYKTVIAENERLNFLLNDAYENNRGLVELLERAKAEAYKECIEKAKNKILPMLTTATLEEKETICFCLNKLDNLLKEFGGSEV